MNENTFYGGRFAIWTSEGAQIPGTRHLLLDDAVAKINNNRFLGCSLEGNGPEYHVEWFGNANTFYTCRWETNSGMQPKIHWAASPNNAAAQNQVFYGFNSANIVETAEPGTKQNHVFTPSRSRVYGGNAGGVYALANTSSTSYPTLTILDAAATPADDPSVVWLAALGAATYRGKARTDTNPRIQLTNTNGYFDWGPGGTGALDTNLYRAGSGQLKTNNKFLAAAGLGVANSAAATTPGTVVKKIPIYDASGNLLGYIPVYDAIT